MTKPWRWVTQREPLFVAGIVLSVGVFLVIRYGTVHALAIVQALGGVLPVLVSLVVRQWVTSPAGRKALTDAQGDVSTLPGLINDVESIKEQLGPLPKTGGVGAIAKWFADLAEHHGKNIEAIAEAAKTDLEAMVHGKVVTLANPPTTEAAPVTVTPTADVPEPVAEPEDPELTKLKGLVGP